MKEYNAWTITKNSAEISVDNWSYRDVEALSEKQAQELAEEHTKIKGHDIYFITFPKYYGYSAIVFYNGHLIRFATKHANQIPYSAENNSKENLKALYINNLNNELFTDQELAAPLKDYHDLRARKNYLVNYYGDREDHVSMFHIFNDEGVREAYREAIKDLHTSFVCHGHYKSQEFVNKANELAKAVEEAQKEKENDYEYLKSAFRYEFSNYECCYGGRYREAAEAVLSRSETIETNEVQRKAFNDAKREYIKFCEEHDIF